MKRCDIYIRVCSVFLPIPEHFVGPLPGEPMGLVGLGVDTDGVGDIGVVHKAIKEEFLSHVVEFGSGDSPFGVEVLHLLLADHPGE